MVENELKGKTALVMGLGLHGGGLETVRYLCRSGAVVSCTDLRNEETLRPSLDALEGEDIHFILGEHRMSDFDSADIIVKNPAVPADSKWIAGRTNIETDISLFLKSTEAPILAVTGSKGKSTVVSALHHILKKNHPGARLGGNITVSPLSFLENLSPDSPVVLELSSWQLADLRGRGILRPRIACITNLMHDHQNRYRSFADYEADKRLIFENLEEGASALFPDDEFGRKWARMVPQAARLVGARDSEDAPFRLDGNGRGWFHGKGVAELILPENLKVPGSPFRINMLFASAIAHTWGTAPELIIEAQESFEGVPYRMEMFLERDGIRYYDDTAATIPDATAAAVKAMETTNTPVLVIAGGTDKELDFSPLDDIAAIPRSFIMLKGSATDTMVPRIQAAGGRIAGIFEAMDEAVAEARRIAVPGDAILLSPGAASFGMFRHEFERGDAFKNSCLKA